MTKVKVGLEIHGYLNMENAKQKLFCECSVSDSVPNTNVCPICTGQPGNKPMLPNKEAIDKSIAIGLMLGCNINPKLLFQRKHYSWPDLPNGYQKTMSGSYATPVGEKGEFLGIGITEVHLEEDPARWDPVTGCVDYNRSGMPLIEMVTDPDFDSPDQVREWLQRLMTTLSYIKAINPDSGVKADVNVNIEGHPRVEVKNVNSFKSIIKAIEFEIQRQEKVMKSKEKKEQHTRAWDDAKGETLFMRSKEQAMEYMFIPEPDLPAIDISDKEIETVQSILPERPHEKIDTIRSYSVSEIDAKTIASNLKVAELFEEIVKAGADPILTAGSIARDFLGTLNYSGTGFDEFNVNPSHYAEIINLQQNNEINEATGKMLVRKLLKEDFSPKEYVKKEGLESVSDSKELEKFCKEAIKENPQAVEDFKKGESKAFNFLVGKVMAKTRGKATPQEVNEIMKRLI
ncbi:Asp-tRNA(Asn)/Glu-tRNA(Gln) amidotransferase subunit GatB [Nanoarchaeota archaeon]